MKQQNFDLEVARDFFSEINILKNVGMLGFVILDMYFALYIKRYCLRS